MEMERAHAILSPSSAHRWLNCPPSALASSVYPSQDTEYTREGTLAHSVAEWTAFPLTGSEQTKEPPFGATQEMFDYADDYKVFIQEQMTDDCRVFLEEHVDFTPWVPQGFGTCDCIILGQKRMTIIDYKYGQGVQVSAEKNPQMMLYALGAYNDFGIAYDQLEDIRMIIYQPRISNISQYDMKLKDLLKWANTKVKPTAAKAIDGKGRYKAGEHCKFCPHAGKCRALTKACKQLVTVHGKDFTLESMSAAEVAEVLDMEPLISLWLKRVKERAQIDLLNGDEIPGWKVVEGKQGNRKWTDESDVTKKLLLNGFDIETITETKLLSPAGMDKSIGKKKVAELLSDLIDRAPGAPTVVRAEDKRPALDMKAETMKAFD